MTTVFALQIGGFTFDITPLTLTDIEYNWKFNGQLVSKVERWPISGFFSDTQANLKTDWENLEALLSTQQDVQFLDSGGGVIDTLLKSDHINSPRFEKLKIEGTNAARFNNINFTFEIIAERSVAVGGLADFSVDRTEEEGPRGRSLTVQAFARGNTARAFVEGLKPNGTTTSRIQEAEQGNTVTGTFTVDQTEELIRQQSSTRGGGGIVEWNETIQVSGGFAPRIRVPIRGDIDPAGMVGKILPTIVTVSGNLQVIADKKDTLERDIAPPAGLRLSDRTADEQSRPFIAERDGQGRPTRWQKDYRMTFEPPNRVAANQLKVRRFARQIGGGGGGDGEQGVRRFQIGIGGSFDPVGAVRGVARRFRPGLDAEGAVGARF